MTSDTFRFLSNGYDDGMFLEHRPNVDVKSWAIIEPHGSMHEHRPSYLHKFSPFAPPSLVRSTSSMMYGLSEVCGLEP